LREKKCIADFFGPMENGDAKTIPKNIEIIP